MEIVKDLEVVAARLASNLAVAQQYRSEIYGANLNSTNSLADRETDGGSSLLAEPAYWHQHGAPDRPASPVGKWPGVNAPAFSLSPSTRPVDDVSAA